jgi:ATP-dependent DNA helicase RecQ
VRKHGKAHGRVLELVAERPKRPGVIYAGARNGLDKLSQMLVAAGVPALAYHAGLDKDVRAARLEHFMGTEAAVMVATMPSPWVSTNQTFASSSTPIRQQRLRLTGRRSAVPRAMGLRRREPPSIPPDLTWALRRIDSRKVDSTVKTAQAPKVRQLYAMLDGTSCPAQS